MNEMTPQEDKIVEEFFERGQFIVNPDNYYEDEEYVCYFWEDMQKASQFVVENPDVHIYTLVEAEDNMYIVPGMKMVNRFANLISVHDAGLNQGEEVRFI